MARIVSMLRPSPTFATFFLLSGVLLACGLLIFSTVPAKWLSDTGWLTAPWDKAVHFLVYGLITLLLMLGTRMRRPLHVLLFVVLIGSLDEYQQLWIPGRTPDMGDWLADLLAGLVVSAIVLFIQERAMFGSLPEHTVK